MTAIHENAREEQLVPIVPAEARERLRRVLDDRRRTLLQRAAELVDDIEGLQTPTATSGQGETEHVSSDVELGMTVALEADTRAALEDINSALARIEDGNFGICATCNEPIPLERLTAIPETQYCLSCQQRHERASS